MNKVNALCLFIVFAFILAACGVESRLNMLSVDRSDTKAIETELTARLTNLLIAAGKIGPETGQPRVRSSPPKGEINKPQMILSETKTDASLLLRFIERLTGDYDLSGDVGIPDITPIAQNYLAQVQWYADGTPVQGLENETLAVIDGDKSGEIGIADITPIANYYLVTLVGYNLYRNGVLIPGNGGAPTLTRPESGEYGWREGRLPVYEFSDNPGGEDRYITYTLKPVDNEGMEGEAYDFTVHYTPSTPVDYPPAKPTGLIATPGDTIVTLDWSDNLETDLAGYNVFVSLTSGSPPSTPHNSTLLTSSDYVVTDLVNDIDYYFWVKAIDTSVPPKSSVYSDEVSATPTSSGIVLQPPTGFTANAGNTSVQLNWDDSIDPLVIGYNVYQSLDELDANPALITPSPRVQSDLLATGLTNDVTYFFWVTCVDNSTPVNESAKAGPINATPSASANESPVASADANPKSGAPPLTVNFYSTGSFDPDGTVATYRWDFTDDGIWDYEDNSTGETQHMYETAGFYTARLQVVDDAGATGEDTINISVVEPGGWTIEIVDENATLLNLALDHFPTGEPAIAGKCDGGSSKVEVNFFTKKGDTFIKELVTSSGGDGLNIAVAGNETVFIGHSQWSEMIEGQAYVHHKTQSSLIWDEYKFAQINGDKIVALGASPEKMGCAGIHTLSDSSFTIHTDIAGNPDKFPTEIQATGYANIAMKSDAEAATWLLARTSDPPSWYRAMLEDTTWTVKKDDSFDSRLFSVPFQIRYVETLDSYVMLGCEMETESEIVKRVIWNRTDYQIENVGAFRWRGITRFGAIGPRGEVFYIQSYNDGLDNRTSILCYLDSENKIDDIPLAGQLALAPAEFAEIDVRPDGLVGIAYQMPDDATLYYATFPHPIP